MKRKLGKKNIYQFIIFSLFVLIIISMFGYAIYKVFSYDKTVYTIAKDSFMYDINNSYLILENEAPLYQKWDKQFYIDVLKDKTVNLGNNVVVYNKNDTKINIYGNIFDVKKNGDISYKTGETEVTRNAAPSFFKLADRKYLIVGKKIKTKDNEISINDYVIVEIDKKGNALLLNSDINVKVITTLMLETTDFTFDVANEKLLVGKKAIDLKKINGSSNEYIESLKKEEDKEETKPGNTGSTGGTGGAGGAGGTGGNTVIGGSGSNNNNNIEIIKKANLNSVTSYASYLNLDYTVNDPKGEFISVYVIVDAGTTNEKKHILNKDTTKYRIRDLLPNTEYTLSFGRSYLNEENKEILIDEITDVIKTKTSKIKTTLTINKITNTTINFNVTYDQTYAFETANVAIYSDGQKIGTVPVVSENALSTKGFSYTFTIPSMGYEIMLKLEDCIYNGAKVSSNIQAKFLNK